MTVLSVTGLAAVGWTSAGSGGSRADARDTPTGPTHGSARAPRGKPTPSRSATASPTPSRPDIPATGPGTYVTAPGGSAAVGKGKVLRYRVVVENGIDLSPSDVAHQVDRILADPRGWTADGRSAFRRVSAGPSDFVVRVATPGTVDRMCARQGLDTEGRYNCSVDGNVMVNLRRWLLATPVYAKHVRTYRALIINHEVGHFLGHGHVDCPGPGRPAPAMMQQIKGMHGCVPNVWPYDAHGTYLTGPPLS
ncbi:DUF3152 domain-containing protein [Streptomyces sp. NPDC059690]|uniref:DUF3152 domain-containing protein n=1 Tax=Streptomyces sp. NPDC059690 TaxID=3346907 RepID=UPI0036B7C0DC